MAAKKYYAVKQGRSTGIWESWEACRAAVDGYPQAQYKGFPTREEARAYLGENICAQGGGEGEEGQLLAYVDGSYDHSLRKYAFGCVFLRPDGRIYTAYGNGDNPESLKLRNVTGEMLGAMYAVKCAMASGYKSLEIRYDYEGIEKWVTGAWRSKTDLTRKYALAMQEWGKSLNLCFTKVAAHTNVYYNELADRLAKAGLVQGNGVPRVRNLEDMEEYHGTDEDQ